jgi:hypothetical protein
VHVEVLYGQIIKFAEALVAEDGCFKCLELLEMMLRMTTVIRLQYFSQEKDPVGLGGVKYGWLL